MRFEKITLTSRAVELPPRAAARMTIGAQIAKSQPASVITAFMRAEMPRCVDDTGASAGSRHGGRSSRRKRLGMGGIAFTHRTVRTLGEAREGGRLAGAFALALRGHGFSRWLR